MIEVLDVLGQPQKMVITAHNLRPHISEEETPFHNNFLHLADLAPHKVVSLIPTLFWISFISYKRDTESANLENSWNEWMCT